MVLLHDMGQSLATRKRSMKFLNVTGSPSTNAMFGIEAPEGRTPFQGGSLDITSPRAEAPGLFCLAAARRSTRQPLALTLVPRRKCPNTSDRLGDMAWRSAPIERVRPGGPQLSDRLQLRLPDQYRGPTVEGVFCWLIRATRSCAVSRMPEASSLERGSLDASFSCNSLSA